jgi:hypothetical protein
MSILDELFALHQIPSDDWTAEQSDRVGQIYYEHAPEIADAYCKMRAAVGAERVYSDDDLLDRLWNLYRGKTMIQVAEQLDVCDGLINITLNKIRPVGPSIGGALGFERVKCWRKVAQ